jgi:hypothetical protein
MARTPARAGVSSSWSSFALAAALTFGFNPSNDPGVDRLVARDGSVLDAAESRLL